MAEAVAHRRRIRKAEQRAAKDRQGTRTDLQPSTNLVESEEPRHTRETRHRTAKATGYGASTLDKADEIHAAAEDETQPGLSSRNLSASIRV